MPGSKQRKVVTPIKEQNPNTVVQDHVLKNTQAANVLVAEYDVIHKERPQSCWKKDLLIPRWLLLTLITLGIIAMAAFIIFATVVTLKKEGNGGPCKSNSDCRQDLGLLCNNYRCGCAYSHFWSDSYQICERRRMINRTCVNDSMCDILGSLICINVTLTSGDIQLQCQCKAGMNWNGVYCGLQGTYLDPCLNNANCDTSRFLFCDPSLGSGGECNCNTSMFWNSILPAYGTCEYKRTINQYCYPYNDNWCDNTAPAGQGLICADYTNPYGSEFGVCECPTHQYYNGTASLGNGYCNAQRLYNQSCASTSQCDYRMGLVCLNNLCLCPPGNNYDPTVPNGALTGNCTKAATYYDNCTSIILCSTSANLYCDYTFINSSSVGRCDCNSSWSFWDGVVCANKLSIGGKCTSNTQCTSADGLFCSNYTQSVGTCDCDKNHFWNYTCIIKQWFNTSCTSSYVCDDNRGLFCQATGGILFQKCDCYNTSFIWDSLYVANRSYTCVLKMGYGAQTCFGNLECQDFNYLKCFNGTCLCNYTDYFDGVRCQAKLNYTDSCFNITMCRDFAPVNLVCRIGGAGVAQCLCNITSYWSDCLQACIISKQRHQACTLTSNCSSNECDVTKNLQCQNDTNNNQTVSGWCNCTSIQWWNGTYCRNKGLPSWGVNASDMCNATYQCADYNLVSCPLGSSTYLSVATCECATTKYWNGLTCLDRVIFGQACIAWTSYPVNTTTCLSAAGAGLLCGPSAPSLNNNYTGTCYCPPSTTWNSTFLICASNATTPG